MLQDNRVCYSDSVTGTCVDFKLLHFVLLRDTHRVITLSLCVKVKQRQVIKQQSCKEISMKNKLVFLLDQIHFRSIARLCRYSPSRISAVIQTNRFFGSNSIAHGGNTGHTNIRVLYLIVSQSLVKSICQ